jgi:hypothetical protein
MIGRALELLALTLPRFWYLLPAAFVAGMGMEQCAIGWNVSLQKHIPADRLARVYSVDAVGSFVSVPLGQMVVGSAAAQFGAGPTLTVLSAVVLSTVLFMISSREVRRLA